MSHLKLENIVFGYQKDKLLFEGLSLAFSKGETVGLVGSNGAGKSTLLKLLVGLNEANSGQIRLDELVMKRSTIKAIREKIGFAFQDADCQLFMPTVYEDVAFGPRNQGLSENEVNELVREALERVEATHLSDRPPYKLSGGEKRAVTLGTVLSMRPEVIILDEPATGLDPRSRRNLIRLLQELPQTVIIATHDMDMALEICDRVLVMHKGDIVMDGNPEDVFRNIQMLEDCHLEPPLSMQKCPVCQAMKKDKQ